MFSSQTMQETYKKRLELAEKKTWTKVMCYICDNNADQTVENACFASAENIYLNVSNSDQGTCWQAAICDYICKLRCLAESSWKWLDMSGKASKTSLFVRGKAHGQNYGCFSSLRKITVMSFLLAFAIIREVQ